MARRLLRGFLREARLNELVDSGEKRVYVIVRREEGEKASEKANGLLNKGKHDRYQKGKENARRAMISECYIYLK